MQLAEVFGARVVDVAPESMVIEMAGSEAKIDGLLEVLRPYGVLEMVRTGRVAMSRGVGSGRPAAGRPPQFLTARRSVGSAEWVRRFGFSFGF